MSLTQDYEFGTSVRDSWFFTEVSSGSCVVSFYSEVELSFSRINDVVQLLGNICDKFVTCVDCHDGVVFRELCSPH